MAKILAFAGSTRKGSFNRRLVEIASAHVENAGAEVELISLADFDMPIFNEDLESASFPEAATRLQDKMADADGMLIGCPEYNSSITPLLKNTIDWTSRANGDHAGLACWSGKAVGLCAASGGALGGLRGLYHVREIMGNIGVHVVPTMVAVGGAPGVFKDDTTLDNERSQGMLVKMTTDLARLAEHAARANA